MDTEQLKNKVLSQKFITIFILLFICLYIFCTFISFLGQLPILLIITFFITYYLTSKE
jgi:hypothetical protein